jgi:hypothetical protein
VDATVSPGNKERKYYGKQSGDPSHATRHTPHATRHTPHLLVLFCLLIAFVVPTQGAQKKVLFYGPTHEPNGAGAALISNNPAEFAQIGQGSAIWTPGASNANLDWSKKTLADFQAFDAIVIGDPSYELQSPEVWAGAIANRAIWSAAITGNVLLYGEDPELHFFHGVNAAGAMIENGIRFAADGTAPGPGFFVCFSTMNPDLPSPVDPMQRCSAHLLSGLGTFTMVPGDYDVVRKLYSHPVTDCLTEEDLSFWQHSSHSGFTSWPAGYVPLALMTDASAENRTPPGLLPAGEMGLVHLLAKGSFKQFKLTPASAGHLLGGQHTVTATYLSETGVGIVGANIQFSVLPGSANSPAPATYATGIGGTVSWTYTGNNAGIDTIQAVVLGVPGCPPIARSHSYWASQSLSIVATDPNAAEPSTPSGAANTGTFTVTRSGNIAAAFSFFPTIGGTAFSSLDYSIPNIVSFAPNQATATITVTPLYDTESEGVETVVATIESQPGFGYVAGNPSEATVNITSATFAQITLTVLDGNVDETGNNPGRLRLTRSDAPAYPGEIRVKLGFGGTATYQTDYLLSDPTEFGGWDIDGIVTMPAGVAFLDVDLVPIPDTRVESLPGETAGVTLLASPDNTYLVGSPASQTLVLLETSTDQIPPSGWEVLEIGYYYGTPNNDHYDIYAAGINTVSDGSGGWKGQVVGDLYYYPQYFYNYPGPQAFRWDNFNWSFLPTLSPQYSVNCSARGINDAGFVTGVDSYTSVACVWKNGVISHLPNLYGGTSSAGIELNQWNAQQGTGGIIVGTVTVPSPWRTQTVAWVPDGNGNYTTAPVSLGDVGFGNRYSYPAAINKWGEVAGKSQTMSGNQYHAFRSRADSGVPLVLSPFQDDMGTATFMDSHSSEANDINDYGELVGASQCPGGQYRAVYKAPDSGKNMGYADLGVLGIATSSVATSINNRGLIVGSSGAQAFVVSNLGSPGSQPLLKLVEKSWVHSGNNWVRADVAGWSFNGAKLKLNEVNWIVGYGTRSGTVYGFALKPRP